MVEERVYVIGTPGSRTVKIGRSIHLTKRLAEIQRMSPVPLEVLWSHPGGSDLETNLHRQFSALRVHGEWFAFSNDPVHLVRSATEEEPWSRPRVSLKKQRPKKPKPTPRVRSIPAPRAALAGATSPELLARMDRLVAALQAIEDPEERYRAAERVSTKLKAAFRERRKTIVLNLKSEGRAWAEVGALIGVTGARAQQVSQGKR